MIYHIYLKHAPFFKSFIYKDLHRLFIMKPKGNIEYKAVGLQIDTVLLKKTDRTVKALNMEGLKSNRSEVVEAIIESFFISEKAAATEKVKELVIEKRIQNVDKRGGDMTKRDKKKNGTGLVSQAQPAPPNRSEKRTAQGG